jgi:nucleoside-diphosphate-sugar epimerase
MHLPTNDCAPIIKIPSKEIVMKVLFIGGTGIISSACSRIALEQGIDLYLLNRGQNQTRPAPAGAQLIQTDYRDPAAAAAALASRSFDAVVNFIAFTPDQIEADLNLFRGRIGQYIFISSASAYQKPVANLPITESTPLSNPYWLYSRNKIACEERLMQAYRDEQFPVTILRPSHTYDKTGIPMSGGWTIVDRMRRGQKTVVHGDGTTLWVLTHHEDFARAFVGLLGNPHTIGDNYHITSDEVLTWDQIHAIFARLLGVEPRLVHVPSDVINAYDARWGASLLGDKTHTVIFDNTKIKRLVPGWSARIPFYRGAEEVMEWYLADPARQKVDPAFNDLLDRLILAQESIFPKA